ncbi:FecR domain-containing protein [Agriterribacter sp.]|uniref:FecR family protein n=1 Tax=Agriterribacter sp. TaxID=2821509 RepID=UPI002B98738C|nr:FecR domain-containing protein [Agriterribacter sp.]HRP57338.1 FecR domain-containing protein [Agriterribacter sp.]
MHSSRLAYLFHKYINKEYTPIEKEELMLLIKQGENDEALKKLISDMMAESNDEMELPVESGDAILQSVLAKEAYTGIYVPVARKRHRLKRVSIAAASIAVCMLTVYLVGYKTGGKKEVAKQEIRAPAVEVSTGTAQRKTVRLPDGTQVWLSPSTVLEYPSAFGGGTREVKLSGEAFFEVAHDARNPFIITSDNIQTKVLGTSFNIQAYHNQKKIAVMVVTGKVKLSNLGAMHDKIENVEIAANQKAVFDKNTDRFIKEDADTVAAPNMLKRKEGEFVYKNERLQKLIDDLQEYFGVNIQVAREIRECKVTANFYVTDDLQDTLEPIAISVNGDLQKNNNEFFINGKGCPE